MAGPQFSGAKTRKFLQLFQKDGKIIDVTITNIEIGVTKRKMLERESDMAALPLDGVNGWNVLEY